MTRPDDLPEFENPPLNEVFIGVQFDPPQGYQQIRAGEVWKLFSSNFPDVHELRPLPPQFETFGLPTFPQLNFGVVTSAMHDRFWFLNPSGDELIQFQQDRFLRNWRKVSGKNTPYPRFETIFDSFNKDVLKLEQYFDSLSPQKLSINQCEISYINHISDDDTLDPLNPSQWLKCIGHMQKVDDFTITLRRTITDEIGNRIGRLNCEAMTAFVTKGKSQKEIIVFQLTARGIPKTPNIEAALEFICKGRDLIVRAFAEMTTESAHAIWKRQR